MNLAPSSSPDPLNDTPTFSSPAKVRVTRSRKSLPLLGSSPKKQTFQLDIGDQLSPQKIRVTVEAEPPVEKIGRRAVRKKDVTQKRHSLASPVRQNVRTTTTTIPLKGLSDTEGDRVKEGELPIKRGRGRPRKSTGTPVKSKAQVRTVTPAGKQNARRRRTLGNLVDGDDSDDWDFTVGDGVEIGRGKGRSKSRSVKDASRSKTTTAESELSSPGKAGPSITNRGQGTRKNLTSDEILIHEDSSPDAALQEEEAHTYGVSGGVLAPRHENTMPLQSTFSTIRSTTTISNDDPDILLAKFVPENDTLTKTGWSSPRIVHALERNIAPSALSTVDEPSRSSSCDVEGTERSGNIDLEGESEAFGGDFQESDTVLESEGFSMISVDCVPSLLEHLSSPPGLSQSCGSNKPIAPNDRTERLRSMHCADPEDSFSSIAAEILEAATPRKRQSKSNLLAVKPAKDSGEGDSFSSLPPEVLIAATPAKPLLHPHYQALKSNASKTGNDSFSSIPSAVLEAATPAAHRNIKFGKVQRLQIPEPVPKTAGKSTSTAKTTALERSIHDSSGLVTPNETPSPIDDVEGKVHQQTNPHLPKPTSTKLQSTESSVAYPQLKSSPPSVAPRRFTYTAHLRQQRLLRPSLAQTPSIVFSSPSLPPLIQNMPVNRKGEHTVADSREAAKQGVSPIVRAGRVLQDMTSSSSARSRSESLGSPFKSPSARRKTSETSKDVPKAVKVSKWLEPTKEIEGVGDKLFGGFSDDTRRELRRSMMIGEEHATVRDASGHTKQPTVARSDDPFVYGRGQIRPTSLAAKQSYTLGLPGPNAVAYPMLPDAPANGDTFRSEGAMSWQAEDLVQFDVSSINAMNSVNTPHEPSSEHQKAKPMGNTARETTEVFERRREAEWARERAQVSSAIESASTSQVIVIISDAPSSAAVDEFEEDIWQAEARDSSALSEELARKNGAEKKHVEKPRRRKIPSQWRQNSKRLTYSDELAQPYSPPQPEKLVNVLTAKEAKPNPIKATIQKPALAQDALDDELPDSSIVWHIPQKMNFAPNPRNYGDHGVSALLASPLLILPKFSPRKPPPARSPPLRFPLNRRAEQHTSQSAAYVSPQDLLAESTEDVDESNCSPKADSGSESESDVFHTPPSIRSSQKTCIRTPTAATLTKSVTFTSATPSKPRLSSTEWTRDHWLLIQKKYEEAKSQPEGPFLDKSRQIPGVPISWDAKGQVCRDEIERETGQEPSKLIGRLLRRRTEGKITHLLTATKWHLDIVAAFRAEVPGWQEDYIARRLLAIMIGEEMRRLGTRHLVKRRVREGDVHTEIKGEDESLG